MPACGCGATLRLGAAHRHATIIVLVVGAVFTGRREPTAERPRPDSLLPQSYGLMGRPAPGRARRAAQLLRASGPARKRCTNAPEGTRTGRGPSATRFVEAAWGCAGRDRYADLGHIACCAPDHHADTASVVPLEAGTDRGGDPGDRPAGARGATGPGAAQGRAGGGAVSPGQGAHGGRQDRGGVRRVRCEPEARPDGDDAPEPGQLPREERPARDRVGAVPRGGAADPQRRGCDRPADARGRGRSRRQARAAAIDAPHRRPGRESRSAASRSGATARSSTR